MDVVEEINKKWKMKKKQDVKGEKIRSFMWRAVSGALAVSERLNNTWDAFGYSLQTL